MPLQIVKCRPLAARDKNHLLQCFARVWHAELKHRFAHTAQNSNWERNFETTHGYLKQVRLKQEAQI